MNSYYAAAARLGIDVLYDAEVVGIDVREASPRVRFAELVSAFSRTVVGSAFSGPGPRQPSSSRPAGSNRTSRG